MIIYRVYAGYALAANNNICTVLVHRPFCGNKYHEDCGVASYDTRFWSRYFLHEPDVIKVGQLSKKDHPSQVEHDIKIFKNMEIYASDCSFPFQWKFWEIFLRFSVPNLLPRSGKGIGTTGSITLSFQNSCFAAIIQYRTVFFL